MGIEQEFLDKVSELSAAALSSELGSAVKRELERPLTNLARGMQRKLQAKLLAEGKEVEAPKVRNMETQLVGLMAKKVVDRIIVPDLKSASILSAPSVLRKVGQELSLIDETALTKITEKEIQQAIDPKSKSSLSPTAKLSESEALDQQLDALGVQPITTSKPRPRSKASSSSGSSWASRSYSSGGKYGRSGGKW